MKLSFLPLIMLVAGILSSSHSHATEHSETKYNWSSFMQASEARFQAQFERAKMMSIQDEACQQEKEAEQLLHCLENDVFVRQAVEQSGLTAKDYAHHWQTLQNNNQRFNKTFRDYESLKARWR